MFEKIRKMKNKKGFTLVELIVVLVILAILAALLIPALTGYIDKANKEKVVAETRMVAMAVQTELSEAYGQVKTLKDSTPEDWASTGAVGGTAAKEGKYITEIKKLAEVFTSNTKATFQATANANGSLVEVKYNDGAYTCTYDATNKTYNTEESKTALTNTVTIQ